MYLAVILIRQGVCPYVYIIDYISVYTHNIHIYRVNTHLKEKVMWHLSG